MNGSHFTRQDTVSAEKDLMWTQPWHRERDSFVRLRSAYSFERFVNLPRVAALRILDFGSGQGHLEGNKLYGRVRL
jgi:2-polyprenyl-3-methyl-5-hydroxy-6-metoxy-1,4-benzoquinol methylase